MTEQMTQEEINRLLEDIEISKKVQLNNFYKKSRK